ncbi:MAG: HAD-superfamily hydrolase subfamily [Gemmatimonadetes bacterium]|nr:HAD-superfamily hydrolase subfamily [Gemmatimonadota bacterium]
MPAPAYPTVLFDLDGTLLDSIELILRSARYSFEKLNREWITDEVWSAGIGIPLFTAFGKYAKDETDHAALIAGYREYQLANHDRLIRCYDDVVDTVKTLAARGHEIAIVTSKSEALAMRGLVHVGLARYMDTIVGCDASTRHKPDPEPVRIALHRLGCRPEDAIFVGDSVHDILAGNAAGVRTVAALWGAGRREEMEPGAPSAYAATISDVLALISE